MKRIIGIFTAFLLPALPAFAAFDDFAQSYDSCKLDVNFDTVNMELSDLPEKYQKMVETHAKEKVTKAFKGHCNNVAYSCEPGDYVTCNPCELLFYIEDLKDQYTDELIEEKCGHLKKTSKKTNTSSSTATASAANSDFDFVAAQKKDRAAWETGNDAPTYQGTSKNTTTKKQTKKNPSNDYDELQRVGEIHAADAEADAERSQPKQTKQTKKQEPDFDFAAASANDMNATVARSGLGNTLAPEPTTPEKSERQKQIEENTKKSLTVQPKPEKKKADTVFEISGNFEIDNGTMPSNVAAKLSPATCKSVGSKYISGKKFTKGYQCPAETTSVTFTFITEDAKANAKYNIENSTQTVQLSGKKKYTLEKTIKFVTKKATCDWSTHYLDSKKNKCVAKSTVKCANDEVVNNAGECQKNVSVNIQKPGDMTGHEWSQTDRERMKCDQDKDKKHTKFENNKCVCESADYEMQSDGYCTLKRAKCLKQRNTKYENGRCVCESSDFEMHKDNNCYYTAEAIDRNEEEMLAADEEETNKKLNASAKQGLCELTDGTWKNGKCKCPNGYELSDTGECEMTKKTQTAAEKQKSCTDSGGTWSKNTCNCEKRNTVLLNDKCVCVSNDFEMHADKACYYTAEAIDRNEEEMIRDDENKSHIETLKLLCEGGETKGTWTDDFKCECPDGYAVSSTNECEITDEAQKNANKEKACTETDGKWNNKTNECKCKTGFTISREGKCVSTYDEEKANSCAETGGKWTKKNTCNCKNGWNLDADGFCQPNDKTAANNHKKELCTEPNKWNDTLKKCTCKDKKQFFDEETGCVSASADFLAAETELNTLKQQFETKKAELASAN